jgi:hypothetical protein
MPRGGIKLRRKTQTSDAVQFRVLITLIRHETHPSDVGVSGAKAGSEDGKVSVKDLRVVRLFAPDGVSACQYFVDKRGDRCVHLGVFAQFGRGVVRCCGVFQDPDNLFFRQDVPIIQGQQQRLADCQGGVASHIGNIGHRVHLSKGLQLPRRMHVMSFIHAP